MDAPALSQPTSIDESFLASLKELRQQGAEVEVTTVQDGLNTAVRYVAVAWRTHNPAARAIGD